MQGTAENTRRRFKRKRVEKRGETHGNYSACRRTLRLYTSSFAASCPSFALASLRWVACLSLSTLEPAARRVWPTSVLLRRPWQRHTAARSHAARNVAAALLADSVGMLCIEQGFAYLVFLHWLLTMRAAHPASGRCNAILRDALSTRPKLELRQPVVRRLAEDTFCQRPPSFVWHSS